MIALSDRRRRRQLELLQLTEDDVRRVQAHGEKICAAARTVMGELPRLIQKYPDVRRIMDGHSIERHRCQVGKHIASLAGGLVDDAYVAKRITIGQIHDNVNVAPHLYMSGFELAFSAFVDTLKEQYIGDREELSALIKSFGKLFNLDMQLILEAYFESYELKIRHLAYYDALTELPNRALFHDRVNIALEQARRTGRAVAVLFVNLDRFKAVNDTFGREAGDRFLKQSATTISQTLRPGDTLARLGGDEFGLLAPNLRDEDESARIAKRITAALEARPCVLDGEKVTAQASVGIALFPGDGDDAATLVERADRAMQHAKRARSGYRFYTNRLHEEVTRRLATEHALRRALHRDEFVLYYQPQFELATGRLIGFEALLRWRREDGTWVGPDEFIPLAEETDLIVPIGAWVFRTAVRQLRRWHDEGFDGVKMAVNVSPVQLRRPDLAAEFGDALAEAGVAPEWVELEMTENFTLHDVDAGFRTLAALRDVGVGVAIDDFGTGYSSLQYLKDLPIDGLKIDRTFIASLLSRPASRGIVETMITLARNLRLHVTAEGVETAEQLNLLQRLGCHRAQGFFLGRPAPADIAAGFLTADSTVRRKSRRA